MPPTIPYFRSPRGHCAAAAITISTSTSSGSDQSFSNTLVILSSASDSRGGDEASRGGQRSVPRHRRSPSPEPSAVPVRSATVATVASFFNGSGGHVSTPTSRRTTATQRRSPSPCSVLSVRAPGGGAPASPPSSGGGGDDEVTSRSKRKLRYRKWDVRDELKVLTTLAELRWENLGVHPQASVLLKKVCADGGLLRRGVDATDLSDKVCRLKKKFVKTADKVAASGGRRLRNYRNRVLYKTSMEVWPDLLPGDVAAAVLLQEARAAETTPGSASDRRSRLMAITFTTGG